MSVVVSWLAAAVVLGGLCRVRQIAGLVPPDWRVVAVAATFAHVVASALIYAPLVHQLQRRLSRGATCAVVALFGALPWLAVMLWRARGVDAALAAARTPEAWLLALFFILSAGGFGLLRHERDPRIVVLEQRLELLERERV